MHSGKKHVAVFSPVKFIDCSTGLVKLATRGSYRSAKIDDVVKIEHARLIVHWMIVPVTGKSGLFMT